MSRALGEAQASLHPMMHVSWPEAVRVSWVCKIREEKKDKSDPFITLCKDVQSRLMISVGQKRG